MKVKAKFYVSKVAETGSAGKRHDIQEYVKDAKGANVAVSTGQPVRVITMYAVGDDGNKENASFARWTPSGTIEFTLDNPALKDEFKPGQFYYVEFEAVPEK